MTDKEKREFKDGVISIFKKFNILDHTANIGSLRDDILRYIDSLQEETVELKEVDLEAIVEEAFDKYSSVDGYGQLVASFNRAELYSFVKKIARGGE